MPGPIACKRAPSEVQCGVVEAICPSSIDDGLNLRIVFAAAATVAEQPKSCVTVSATVRTDRGRDSPQGRSLLLFPLLPLLLQQG